MTQHGNTINAKTSHTMLHRPSSRSTGNRNTQISQQQCEQHSALNNNRRLEPPRYIRARYGAAAELSQMIDEHVASWQFSQASDDRPTSKGTVIVDWDGSGHPAISYRRRATVVEEVLVPQLAPAPLNHKASSLGKAYAKQGRRSAAACTQKPLPSLPTDERVSKQTKRKPLPVGTSGPFVRHDSVVSEASNPSRRQAQYFAAPPSIQSPVDPQHAQYATGDGFTADYHPPRYSKTLDSLRRPYITGYDQMTRFRYDYDGHIFHAHRSPSNSISSPRWSAHSDYFGGDVDEYDPQAELRVEDKDLLSLSAGEGRKRHSVGRFVEKVLFKLSGLGLTEKLSCDRKTAREGGTSWQEAGYHT